METKDKDYDIIISKMYDNSGSMYIDVRKELDYIADFYNNLDIKVVKRNETIDYILS